MASPVLVPVPVTEKKRKAKKKPYVPILSEVERRAYYAAHRIMSEDCNSATLVTPGARRSFYIDRLASIIKESFEQ